MRVITQCAYARNHRNHESITSRHRCLQNGSAISHKYSNWNYAFHLEVQILGHQSTTYFFMVHSQLVSGLSLSLSLFSFNLDSGLKICTLWWFCPVKRQSNHGFSMQASFQQLAFGHHQVYKQKSAGKFSRNRQVLKLLGFPANFLIGAIAVTVHVKKCDIWYKYIYHYICKCKYIIHVHIVYLQMYVLFHWYVQIVFLPFSSKGDFFLSRVSIIWSQPSTQPWSHLFFLVWRSRGRWAMGRWWDANYVYIYICIP